MTQVLDLVEDLAWAFERGVRCNTEEWAGHQRFDPTFVSLPGWNLRVSRVVFFGQCGLHRHSHIEVTIIGAQCSLAEWLEVEPQFTGDGYGPRYTYCPDAPTPVSFDANLEDENGEREATRVTGVLIDACIDGSIRVFGDHPQTVGISRMTLVIGDARRWKCDGIGICRKGESV